MEKRFFGIFLLLFLITGLFTFGITEAFAATATQYGDLYYTISNGEVTITDCQTSATSVTIPSTINGYPVTRIGGYAFYKCTSLTSVIIPNSVTGIGFCAFGDCHSLTSVTIPNSVKKIDSAFHSCFNLTDVYYTGTQKEWSELHINLDDDNDLANATIHYNAMVAGKKSSLNSQGASELSLTIYENKKGSDKVTDDYRLSENAVITNSAGTAKTDKNGFAVIKDDGSDITVSKENYISVTISADRAKKAQKVYLQKDEGDKPVIRAVWIDDTDVYSKEYPIDITGKASISIKAEITWKSGSQGKIYLMQDARRVQFSGDTLTTVLSDNFDVSKTVYIVAEDANGNATKKKLMFKADGGISDMFNDYKLTFGDSVSGTIPSSIPVIGGNEIGLDVPMIPLTVTFENNKFYAVLGLDVAKASKEYSFIGEANGNSTSKFEKETKYLFENIKDSFTKSTDKYRFSKLKEKWKNAKCNYSAKVGFEADCTVIGYIEGYVDSSNKVSILDGGVGINPSIKLSAGSQILAVPPLYWEAELKGEIEAMLNVYLNETAKSFTPNGSVGGDITLKGGVGLGVSGAIGVSGGLKGNIGLDWDIYRNKQDYIALSGSIGAYVKAIAGPLTIIDKDFDFANGIIWDYPSTRVNSLALAGGADFYDTSGYSLISRSYAENESYFLANNGGIALLSLEPQNKVENVLKTNVYTYSEPKLAEFSDGTRLAIWLDDDNERADINRTALYYSYFDGSEWSEPEQVDNDGTGDYSPELEIINNKVYIVWVNAKNKLENDVALAEIFNTWEINVAEFDKENCIFTNVKAVTDDAGIDMMPKIFGDESTVEIIWVKNSSDDIFSEAPVYSIMTYTLGEEGGAEIYADGLMPVDSLDGCIHNGQTYIAYTIDTDGNQTDYSDKEIYLNNTLLTDNDVLDSKPVFANGSLYYYSGGTITKYNLSNKKAEVIADNIQTDRFDIITDGENVVAVYGQTDEFKTELYAIFYDSVNDKWGESVQLTKLDADISSYSGVFSTDGELKLIVNKTEVSEDSEKPYGQTDISFFSVTPAYNLSLESATYHEELLLSGNTLEFYTEIKNNGELTVNKYKAQVADENGNVLATTYGDVPILPGKTVEFTAYYPLGNEAFAPHNVKLSVLPMDISDLDESDNSIMLYLNYENISLENLDYGINAEGEAVIFGDIVNRGYGEVDSVTAYLYKDSCEGEPVKSVTVNKNLNTLDLANVSFTVPFENEAVYYVKLSEEGQNSDFVVLNGNKTKYDGEISHDVKNKKIIVNSEENIANAELIVAIYEDKKLVDIKTQSVSLTEGENKFDDLISEYGNADVLKIMIWDSLKKMSSPFEAYEEKLK